MTGHLGNESGSRAPLKGKTALITGASRRIGRALAVALAEAGANIVAHDRTTEERSTALVCGEVEACGSRSWQLLADLEQPGEYGSLIERALAAAGSLDILINNASIFQPGSVDKTTFDDLVKHIHVNAWTPFVLSREFHRRAKRGSIVNLLDTRVVGADSGHLAYLLSKQMLASLTRICALEFAPEVAVNAVAPGLILPPAGKDEAYLDELAKTVPLKRHGGPQDIVDAVLYLVASRFMTGQVIFVDGGKHLQEG
jgi:NAD(P)-dependent dehydrogenase (short-subunit alcohol dehydrogenase family)